MGGQMCPFAAHGYSSDSGTASGKTTKSRRSHKKSRNGCAVCKSRHIRCDERRPACSNCEAAERICFYSKRDFSAQGSLSRRHNRENQKKPSEKTPAIPLESAVGSYDNAVAVAEHAGASPLTVYGRINASEASGDKEKWASMNVDMGLSAIRCAPAALPMSSVGLQGPMTAFCPGLTNALSDLPGSMFSANHLTLLRHADTVPNFTRPDCSAVDIAVRHAFDSPYLIDEVLAFTAFHMTHLYPGSACELRNLSTELQTRAITCFTRATKDVPHDDTATSVPRFLFSAILGRHVLADTLTSYRSDFLSLIEHFVECLVLNEGIRAITPPARDFFSDSEMQPLLRPFLEAQKNIKSQGTECDPLNRLLDNSNLSDANIKVYRQVIDVLQNCFDMCHVLDEEDYPQYASAFPIQVDVGFADMLRRHQPEALVIFSYYGVLLHRCRSFWAFGDSGAVVIRAVARHVGKYWQAVLSWPLQVVGIEQSPESVV